MKKRKQILLILLMTPIAVLLGVYIAVDAFSPVATDQVQEINQTTATNEIYFMPGSIDGELGDTHTMQIALNPGENENKNIKYVNLKIAYDPQNLEILEISRGSASGVYQSTIIMDESRKPVGLANLVWMPNEYGYGSTKDESIGQITVRLLSSAKQSVGITPPGAEGNLVNSSIRSLSGEELVLSSKGLSINGGMYKHDEWLDSGQNACQGTCSSDEVCLGGQCEKLAVTTIGPASNVLGASTDGMTSCEYDSDCIKVSSSCCGCEEGGREIAINKNFESEYLLNQACSGGVYVCLNYNMCEDTIARCVSNLCKLAENNVLGESIVNIEGDINSDLTVDLKDYSIIVSDILLCQNDVICNSRADLDGDGEVSLTDFARFLELFKAD